MNVSLTPKLEKLIQKKVKEGFYHSASEVIRDGLRLLEERDQLRTHRLQALREDLQVGVDQADQGGLMNLDAQTIKAKGRGRRSTHGKNKK